MNKFFPGVIRTLLLVISGAFLVGNAQASLQIFIEDSQGDVISCEVDGVTQNQWGDVIVTNPSCLGAVTSSTVTVHKLKIGDKYCVFSSLQMNDTGRVVVTASNSCVTAQPVGFVLQDDDFSTHCEADVVSQSASGVLYLDGSACASTLKEGPLAYSRGTMVFKDGPIERGCAFKSLGMDGQGNIVVTAQGSCFGDSDGDLIPDPMDPNNAQAATDNCVVEGDANWESVSISGARYINDVTCELPKPEYIVVADVVFGGYQHEALSYPPDVPITADYYATQSIALLGPVSVKGGSSFTVDSGKELSIWGPFKVTAGSEFRVVPLTLSVDD